MRHLSGWWKILTTICIIPITLTIYIILYMGTPFLHVKTEKVKSLPYHKQLYVDIKSPAQCSLVKRRFLRRGVDLRVIILTFNRPHSVLRLLNSLNRALYNGSKVVVEVWVDRFYNTTYSIETINIAHKFVFEYGSCDIHIHKHHVGIRGQWLETWRSYEDANEIVVIMEDDITVSSYFYTWLKLVHKTYEKKSDVAGFSLQGYSVRHNDSKCCLNISKENIVFLYTTIGTWGFSPKNKHWMEYKKWSAINRRNRTKNSLKVPNHITWKWHVAWPSSVWGMEYIYYTWTHKQFILYPNFKDQKGLTFNWLESGLHYNGRTKINASDERKGLILTWNAEYEDLPAVPVYVNTDGIVIKPQ